MTFNRVGMSSAPTTMPALDNDTIAAISSPFGEGAVGLIRITGDSAFEVLDKTLRSGVRPAGMESRKQYLGRIVDPDGQVIDEVLATVFRNPASYTGQDVAEIACHGGAFVTRRVLDTILAAGARPAGPGEFTQRAFLNGKMDLTQAEAVMDLIRSESDLALTSAHEQLSGGLGRGMESMRSELLGVLAHLEAYIDFPEEGIDPDTGQTMIDRVRAAREEVVRLLGTADRGRILRHGVATVICGAPNVGKSSLLNALSGRDRAIVSDIAGTTRDTIEDSVSVGGYLLRLIDTAGLRDSEDQIEREGIERTHQAIGTADLVIEVLDGSVAPSAQVRVDRGQGGDAETLLVVLNKSDLGCHGDWASEVPDAVVVSSTNGSGVATLSERIAELLSTGAAAGGTTNPVAINARHQECLRRAQESLDETMVGMKEDRLTELIAIDLRTALDAIGDVVGRADTEDLLGEIFANFCIGK